MTVQTSAQTTFTARADALLAQGMDPADALARLLVDDAVTAAQTRIDAARKLDRVLTAIRRTVDALNKALGLDPADDRNRVSFGYIGNCDFNGRNDDRSWMVFLPHPGRIGTAADQLGGFSTSDLSGAQACLTLAAGALALARWQRS